MFDPEQIIDALGGEDNIDDLEGCITRLRVEVDDPGLVDVAELRQLGAHGVITQGSVVQVIVGPEADIIAQEINDILDL